MQEEIDDLEELAKSLSKNNPEGEVKAWAEKFHGLDTQFREILVVRDNLRSRDRYATKLLGKIRDLLKVERNRDIMPALQDLLR